MAQPNLLPGNRFRIYRSATLGPPETWTFVCTANSVTYTDTTEFEDSTVPDCAVPTSIPWRQSIARSAQWSVTFSGPFDAKLNATVRSDKTAQVSTQAPTRYQILVDQTLANGGGTITGALWFESIALAKANNGMVTYTVTARGEGPPLWADAAA